MEINESTIKKLIDLTNKNIKSIKKQKTATIIEFEDGEILPLFGGQLSEDIEIVEPSCSFCGTKQSKNFPLMGPPGKNEPMICSKCASKAVETFIQNNVEIELDISVFPDHFKNKFLNME